MKSPKDPSQEALSGSIAIAGVSCLFPKARSVEEFWSNIRNGVDAITEIPTTHWDPKDFFDGDPKSPDMTYARRGGFLSPVPFDPMEFGVSPRDIEATDTTQLLGLVAAKRALDDAGYGKAGKELPKERTSVILGVTGTLELVIPLGARLGHPIWRKALRDAGVDEEVAADVVDRISDGYVGWQENSFPGLLGNVAAGRIANRLDLGGTNCVVDAACASSLSAVHLACLELLSGRSDVVISGGLDTFNDIFMYMCFSKTPALSATGDAKPFSNQADGTILGEGLGVVVLKRLEDAERDGDRIYAVIQALASSSDGKGNAVYAPVAEGQEKALRRTYEMGGVTPDSIELVEAHGTGTKVGDATEVKALSKVYGEAGEGSWCALGSVKSQIGHTKAAAGAAGLIKAALALHHKVLPPTIKVKQPHEAVTPETTPFYVNVEKRPWVADPSHPRRAALSAFGFGGSNFHCLLEEHGSEKKETDWDGSIQLLPLSAASSSELTASLEKLSKVDDWDQLRLAATEFRDGFDAGAKLRLVMILERDGDWRQILSDCSRKVSQNATSDWSVAGKAVFGTTRCGKLGVLFPGQGSQRINMLKDLVCQFPEALESLNLAEKVRGREEGRLTDFLFPQPAFDEATAERQETELRRTDRAQPALGVTAMGAWKVLQQFGVEAGFFGGHSYGELVALCAGGRLSEEDLHKASLLRGRLMAEAGRASGGGTMTAVKMGGESMSALLGEKGLKAVVANVNSPEQVVIAGSEEDIEAAEKELSSLKVWFKRLPVAAAFHSELVAEAAKPFTKGLAEVSFLDSDSKVYSNTTAGVYPSDEEESRELLGAQLSKPVDFVGMVKGMREAGVDTFLEVGGGSVLGGLVKAITKGENGHVISLDASRGKKDGVLDLAWMLAQLSALGMPIAFDQWDTGAAGKLDVILPAKGRMTLPICGANYRAPYQEKPPTPKKAPVVTEPKPAVPATPVPQSPQVISAASSSSMDSESIKAALQDTRDAFAAMQRLQEQTAKLHHQFLLGQEKAQQALSDILSRQQGLHTGGVAPSVPVAKPVASAPKAPVAPKPVAPPSVNPAPAPEPVGDGFDRVVDRREILEAARLAEPVTPSRKVVSAPAGGDGNARVEKALLEVVSEKTGYPIEMLNLDMGLDGDLGIDSIKRVEIMSALQDRLPDAPEVKPSDLGSLETLRQVVEFLSRGMPAGGDSGVRAVVAELPAGPGADAVSSALLEVVSEKTGYPSEMLNLDMGLDSDLGIDSIKRVEIMSALQDRLPDAPEVKPSDLGALETLRQVVDFLASAAPAVASSTPAATRPAGADVSAIAPTLLEVVSEKTGYPTDMLNLDMGLDTDLGIDSIKRVEIMSALQERLPEAPEVKPSDLGALGTLRQVAEFLGGAVGAQAATAEPPSSKPSGVDTNRITEVLLEVVSEKTGYPPEMLELDMQMDSDLGIDSIKRVEIMSALQEKLPDAQEVKPNDLGTLQTLRQVVDFLAQSGSNGNAGVSSTHEAAGSNDDDLPPILSQVAERQVLVPVAMGDHFLAEVVSPRAGGEVWIAGEDTPLRKAIEKAFKDRGLSVKSKSFARSLSAKAPEVLSGLVLVSEGDPMEKGSLAKSFQLVQKLGGSLLKAGRGVSFLASISNLDGVFGLKQLKGDPFSGGLAGLVKTASHEWPDLHCKALDVEPGCRLEGHEICSEMLRGGPIEVGLCGKERFGLQLENRPFDSADEVVPLVKGDVVVVSGGSRGVTAETVVALAETFQPTLVLLGRSREPELEPDWLRSLSRESDIKKAILEHMKGKPDIRKLEVEFKRWMANREILHNIERMESAGAKVSYRSVDIRDAKAVNKVLDKVRSELGPIRGLVHGAGVLADRRIEDKTLEQFELVYSTKVDGLRSLLKATKEDPIRVMAFFSSFTGRYGRTGQVDYAIANEVLNKVAHAEALRRPECRVVSANWGPWNGGMVNDGLRKVFEAEGVGLIEPSAGAEYLVKELSRKVKRATPVEVVVLAPGASNKELTRPILSLEPVAVLESSSDKVPAPMPAADSDWHPVMARSISVSELPCLASHVIKGKAVLPAALMSELLAHGALHENPGEKLGGFLDFQVLKGVTLDASESTELRVETGGPVREDGYSLVPMRLVSEQQGKVVAHAQGQMLLGNPGNPGEAKPSILTTFTEDSRGPGALYHPEALFHLKHFQGILSMIGCDQEGFAARVSTAPKPREWVANPWRSRWVTDPLVIDCIYQLMIVWSLQQNDAPCLPSKVELYEQFSSYPKGEVEIRARITKAARRAVVADIEILGAEGEVVARMKACQSTVASSLKAAFRENVLASA